MLVIIDVTDPRHPRESGKLTFGSKKVEEFAFYEHYVYAAQREEGVRIIDVADPANPTLVGTFSTNAVGIAVQGNRAYVIEAGSTPIDWEYSNFLVIYDLGDPLNPVERGRTKVFRAREVIVSGEYAYTAGNFMGTYAGLRCIRVSDPTHPTVVDSALVNANMGMLTWAVQ
ncbi:MAG: hypothetical protein ONB13_07730 [candidate division KSB1 bacterium]|nr:hypothetical protein [candidate division KSB1 bacterium]